MKNNLVLLHVCVVHSSLVVAHTHTPICSNYNDINSATLHMLTHLHNTVANTFTPNAIEKYPHVKTLTHTHDII